MTDPHQVRPVGGLHVTVEGWDNELRSHLLGVLSRRYPGCVQTSMLRQDEVLHGRSARDLLQVYDDHEVGFRSQVLLHAAAAWQHYEQQVAPALADNRLVLTHGGVLEYLAHVGAANRVLGKPKRSQDDRARAVNQYFLADVWPPHSPHLCVLLHEPFQQAWDRRYPPDSCSSATRNFEPTATDKRVHQYYGQVAKASDNPWHHLRLAASGQEHDALARGRWEAITGTTALVLSPELGFEEMRTRVAEVINQTLEDEPAHPGAPT